MTTYFKQGIDVSGNVNLSGNIIIGGDTYQGDSSGDAVIIAADISSNLTPDASGMYNIGTIDKRWNRINAASMDLTDTATINKMTFSTTGALEEALITTTSGDLQLHAAEDIALYPAGNIWISQGTKLIFEGTVPDDFEIKLQATSATADHDLILPDEDGTLATRGWVETNAISDGFTWTTSGDNDQYRTSTGWYERSTGNSVVRSIQFTPDGLLEVELATFSPVVSASGQSLAWDEPATEFTVSVDNPSDFPTRYIDSVYGIVSNGLVDNVIGDYTAGSKSATPAGGIDWTQTFNTNATATIQSSVSSASGNTLGGNAAAEIQFADESGVLWSETASVNFTWQNIDAYINFDNLSGKNFLGKYTGVGYTAGYSGISNPSNVTQFLIGAAPSVGTVSNASGNGTLTFANALHKNNNSGRAITLTTVFNRPVEVSGVSYDVVLQPSDTTISASFTYPSFYYWTQDISTVPTRDDVVNGDDFDVAVIEVGNQTTNISTTINNSSTSPRAFWFAVRSSVSQPTVFQTGPSSALLSDVGVTTGNTVTLQPDAPESGYVAEQYTLYGITLQPGNTYVRIN